MAFALVISQVCAKVGSGSGATSDAVDTSGSNLLLFNGSWYPVGTPTPTLTDSYSNTGWVARDLHTTPNTFYGQKVWDCPSPTVGSGHTFTLSGTDVFCSFQIAGFSGAHTSPFGGQTGNSSNTSPVNTGSITPSEDNCLLVTGINSGDTNSTPTVGSSFIIPSPGIAGFSSGNYQSGAIAYKIQTSAGAENPQWAAGSSNGIAAGIAWYKAAAGGGGTESGALDVDGVSTVNFTGGATQRGALNSAGAATANFVGAGNMAGALSIVGTSTVNFVGASFDGTQSGALQSDGTSTVNFSGGAIVGGALSAIGVSTVNFAGTALSSGALSINGSSTVNFEGAVAGAISAGALQSDGTSTVNFVGASTTGGALSSDGSSTVNFTGGAVVGGALSIAGISTVNFEGAQQGVAGGALSVTGTSTVNFVGDYIQDVVVTPENPLLAGGAVGYHSAGDRRKRKIKLQDERDMADITFWLETEYFRKAA